MRAVNAALRRLYLRALYAHQRAYAARCEALAAEQRAEQAERNMGKNAFDKIAEGLFEALAIAKGDKKRAERLKRGGK